MKEQHSSHRWSALRRFCLRQARDFIPAGRLARVEAFDLAASPSAMLAMFAHPVDKASDERISRRFLLARFVFNHPMSSEGLQPVDIHRHEADIIVELLGG